MCHSTRPLKCYSFILIIEVKQKEYKFKILHKNTKTQRITEDDSNKSAITTSLNFKG